MPWRWNETANRYQDTDTGRFIKRDTVLDLVQKSLDASISAVDVLGRYVADGLLSVSDWKAAFREEIKGEYIRQYLSGIGGRSQMTQADWGSIGGMLKEQYKYLDNFAAEIALGNLSEAQIKARMAMYINSSREAHERAFGKVAAKAGNDEEIWIMGPVKTDHCDDCLSFSNEGWQPVGYYPMPGTGATRCLTNCNCHKEYRNSVSGATFWGE